MTSSQSKEYIENVYKRFSNYKPLPAQNDQKYIQENYTAPIIYDKDVGAFYNQQPGWYGKPVESLNKAMASYIFQPLGWRP